MDPELTSRFDAIDRLERLELAGAERLDGLMAGMAQQFGLMQARSDRRFESLVESLVRPFRSDRPALR